MERDSKMRQFGWKPEGTGYSMPADKFLHRIVEQEEAQDPSLADQLPRGQTIIFVNTRIDQRPSPRK